ncbi:MAG: PDR/VanB family oxidoreductase [Actinomycetes bacterium]
MSATSTRRWSPAVVRETEQVAEGVRRIAFEPETGTARVAVPPGSHLDVAVRVHGRPDVRSYSLLTAGRDRDRLTVAVRLDPHGRGGSAYLWSLRPGARVRVTQPLQGFPLLYDRPQYVLLAGGIGITALVGMAERLAARGADFRFVYTGRRRAVMPFVDALEEAYGARLRVVESEREGHLDVPGLVADCGGGTEMYVCGPGGLRDAVRRAWSEQEHPHSSLRFETFGSGGRWAPEPFRVRIPRLGIETVVPENASMLEALQRAGADLMYDCRKGECGLCVATVLEAEGALDHRDVFLSTAQQERGNTVLTCVSRMVSRRTAAVGEGAAEGSLAIDVP